VQLHRAFDPLLVGVLTGAIVLAAPTPTVITPDHPDSVQRGITEAYRAGEKRVVIPAGNYYIKPPSAGSHLQFHGISDFESDARDVHFVFTDQTRGGIDFLNCSVRLRGAATLLADGKVLFTGGHILLAATAELYDSVANTFSTPGNMAWATELHTATLLCDGTVLIAGGFSGYPFPTSSAELYHRAGIQFTPTVQIVDNNTGSLMTLAVGDSFSFQVTGAPPISLVSVSEAGWSGSVGYTDASGLFWLNGIVGADVVGTWQQTWSVGGEVAQPSRYRGCIWHRHGDIYRQHSGG
jgi:hypothetical protein